MKGFKDVRILPCFREEMIVQKDPIELEKTMTWSGRNRTQVEQVSRLI